jgi:hypothetical protein
MGSLDHFREELHIQMRRASAWGATAVVINARGLHAAFGDFGNEGGRRGVAGQVRC